LLNPPEAHLPATPPSNESAARFDESERPCVVIRQLRIAGIDSDTKHRSALLAWLRPHADRTRLGDADAVEGKCLGESARYVSLGHFGSSYKPAH